MSYFTVCDFIIAIPMALAGALLLDALPCNSVLKCNSQRLLGAVLGIVFTVVLVDGLPALMC
ncbi:hypothetical protein [Paraburkholderia solisilvae]|uniref:Uncharacterized protein n=1 Tax=Paraburkholderia solisilvae TaxID=624376 RepID=A0A6J5E017_9BURK|nr:hypothetical protein LMG29739_03206 [Paraburkholderia solisilvae]